MNIVQEFEKIRDIPYRIPLSTTERDDCCSGKSEQLLKILKVAGHGARYRVCTFRWSDLNLPNWVEQVPHENECTHTYIEILLDGEWKIVDATWDRGLKNIFAVNNNWDGRSNTEVAVPVRKLFSPKQSAEYMKRSATTDAIAEDLKKNGKFYEAFNRWLETKRREPRTK
ncbi:MAG: hypothetical protein A2945_02135 [Candidatus Liptonbacteria bacterium RIFCSPLOWO2_01_FULL_52_25]|uniref:Transglutaminase-like domain-containing protein n=1 Tax=Candidatus Liptonbacteria bacterium RIFCSPLOWO2_01_FULL_52_25 TaxID=1798650 RepID=A0A1G2CEF1_9BACT|nr:MAG: hypothetical protein A2945_02135 [Candidatus Liptonbacteria bacterium RIFCSPLOWO2_01_FULL_52_25]